MSNQSPQTAPETPPGEPAAPPEPKVEPAAPPEPKVEPLSFSIQPTKAGKNSVMVFYLVGVVDSEGNLVFPVNTNQFEVADYFSDNVDILSSAGSRFVKQFQNAVVQPVIERNNLKNQQLKAVVRKAAEDKLLEAPVARPLLPPHVPEVVGESPIEVQATAVSVEAKAP